MNSFWNWILFNCVLLFFILEIYSLTIFLAQCSHSLRMMFVDVRMDIKQPRRISSQLHINRYKLRSSQPPSVRSQSVCQQLNGESVYITLSCVFPQQFLFFYSTDHIMDDFAALFWRKSKIRKWCTKWINITYRLWECVLFFFSTTQNAYINISHIMTVAQRLCDTGHYAAPSIRLQANKLDKDWRTFAAALEDRNAVLALSVIFHQKAGEVGTLMNSLVITTITILNTRLL